MAENKKISEKITKTVILSVIFGLLSAFVGTFFILSYLLPAGVFNENLDRDAQNQEFLKTSLGIKAYGRLEVFEFLDKSLPALAGVYKKKLDNLPLIDRVYLDSDKLGDAFMITSDGWLASVKGVIGENAISKLTVAFNGKFYNITDIVEDDWTEVVFIKIDAENFPVVIFGDSSFMGLGDIVFTGSSKNNFWFSYINSLNNYNYLDSKTDIILSSEQYGKIIATQTKFPQSLNGSMASNHNGEIIGLVVADKNNNYIIPSNYFKNIIQGVLRDGKIVRPYLGVNYIDLNHIFVTNPPNNTGSYVYGGGFLRSIMRGSPAEKAGLLAGDIILSIDGENVTENKNLAEIISEFKPGDNLILKVLRGSEEIDITVVLD